MARHKDFDWSLRDGTKNADGSTSFPMDVIQALILLDIRDELKTLNRLLGCYNFTNIPATLRGIRRDLVRKKK